MAIFGNLNKVKTGVLPYVLLLLLAIIVLFYISYTAFRQNRDLHDSTELVSQTQEIINEINMLFGNFSGSESAGIKYLVSNDTTYLSPIKGFSDRSSFSLRRLRELVSDNADQQKLLDRLPRFSDQLFEELRSLDPRTAEKILQSKTLRDRIHRIDGYLDSLESIKTEMIATEYALLKARKQEYESNVTLTPTNILYSSLFALGILMFAFSKINSDRKKMTATRAFLQNVLQNTDNIVNYYEPIKNEAGTITDFKVVYTNLQADNDLGSVSEQAIGKKILEVYTFLKDKDVISFLADAIAKNKTVSREMDYLINGKKMWFHTTATPLEKGISTTTRNTTNEKEAEHKLLALNNRLESQNLELASTSGFLQNILSTLQSVIHYFEAVRNEIGEIVDFKISYSNEKIVELIGKSPEEVQGRLISEVYPFFMENGDFELYKKVIESGEPEEQEKKYDLPKGHFYFCNEVAKLDDGVTVVSQDITLRKKAEDELKQTNEDLEVKNTILSDAEFVAGIGSYNWNLTTDTLEYSDNLYRLLGHDPGSFKPTYDKFMSFVHPGDSEQLEINRKEIFEQKKRTEDTFRIKTKDGKTKHVSSMGHFIEKQGEFHMIGVVRDISSQLSNQKKLKARNRELKRSNAELESFNRVASHDLQEPLRKIQMFISRLSETDRKKLSEKGQRYFEKIDESANRMQHLIRNLLSYSRISDESGTNQKVDLNTVFEKVLEDLAEKIKETGAEIHMPELPIIYGTAFQLEQLFNNLLSNSIKYKKHDQSPEIVISSQLLTFDELDPDFKLPRSRYHLLTVSDNGIGFEQEQSDKIFKLFERLHEKNAYSGTGLGLAICKKIVENHRGHIAAYGKHNEGTRIEVYLPYGK